MPKFKAIRIDKRRGRADGRRRGFRRGRADGRATSTVRVTHSTVNYKDGLAITGKSPVVRRFPMMPGIDFAGVVERGAHPALKPGDAGRANGWGVGETHLGAYARAGARQGRLAGAAAPGLHARRRPWRSARPATPPCWRVLALEHHGARRPTHGAGGRDRGGRRRRLGRGRAAGQARLARDRLDGPAGGGRLSAATSARPRSSTARRTVGARQAARQGALGRGHRLRRLAHARQRAGPDRARRRRRGLRPGAAAWTCPPRSRPSSCAAWRCSASTASRRRGRAASRPGTGWPAISIPTSSTR